MTSAHATQAARNGGAQVDRTGTVNAWSLAHLRAFVCCFAGITSCDRN